MWEIARRFLHRHSGLALRINSLSEMERFAGVLASKAVPGDTFCLHGPVGSGKSEFARFFIRSRLQRHVSVPSPTFILENIYTDPANIKIHHIDAYRLKKPEEAKVLNLPNVLPSDICLIEWPEQLGEFYPQQCLRITLQDMFENVPEARAVFLQPQGSRWEGKFDDVFQNEVSSVIVPC
eukprot:TRINITY_DN7926_c0_g2_i4.p1 TRINITY_DN7926_c0_g2~~TRINITY_DN7926_c0_g2_i4.p1  ORF type:complete len:180 (+),score=7.18 TRINITY_DN7926_c0_g2_i4:100-639(+)